MIIYTDSDKGMLFHKYTYIKGVSGIVRGTFM